MARGADSNFTVDIGDTEAEISGVQQGGYDPDCGHYYPGGGPGTTGPVSVSSGQWAGISYGMLSGSRCPGSYGTDPVRDRTGQTSMSFRPAGGGEKNVGQIFLVGTMRHDNNPVFVSSYKGTTYAGSIRVRLARNVHGGGYAINQVFPWTEEDTYNNCTASLDSTGSMVIGHNGGAFGSPSAIPTEWGWDAAGRLVRLGDGTYYQKTYYDYAGRQLRQAYHSGGQLGGKYRQEGYYYYFATDGNDLERGNKDVNNRQCSDDNLRITATRSTEMWEAPNGVKYQLKLWGFTNIGNSSRCDPAVDPNALSEAFVTKERATSYGCLYGSLEQVRPVTFSKSVQADESARVPGKAGAVPPTAEFDNVSEAGSYGADAWPTIESLTPTDWGEAGKVESTQNYTLLAPNDKAAVREREMTPAAVIAADGTVTSSGWRLNGVTCTYGDDSKRLELSGAAGGYLDEKQFDPATRTLSLDQSKLARLRTETDIHCAWSNEYVMAPGRLTLVNVVDSGTAAPTEWTLAATPKSTGLYGQRTITGVSGDQAVTAQSTSAGTYKLSAAGGPLGYTQNGQWSCAAADGSSIPVAAGEELALPEGAEVTCTVRHKTTTTPVSAVKSVAGASDGAALTDYALNYTCAPGADGAAKAEGTVRVGSDGASIALPAAQAGATCVITEQKLDDDGLKAASPDHRGRFSWGEPSFAVAVGKGGASTQVATTAVPATDSVGPGVSFTVPDSTDGDVTIAVTNTVVPHAGVTKTFDRVVKSPTVVGGRDTFDQTYTVVVANPSTAQALAYSVDDTAVAPSGSAVNSVTVTGGDPAHPARVTGPTWNVKDVDLAAGANHTYTVTVNVSTPDSGLTGLQNYQGAQCVDGAPMIRNTATVTTKGDAQGVSASACGDVPANPSFSASKSAVEVTRDAGEGTFTASYEVTVTNTSHVDAAIAQDVRDQLGLPASAKVDRVEVREGGALTRTIPGAEAAMNGGFVLAEAGSGDPLVKVPDGATTGGGTRVLGVRVVFSVDPSYPGYAAEDYRCGGTRADGQPSGLVNTVIMQGDRTTGDDTACLSADSTLRFSKVVATRPGAGSTFDVSYTISVVNEGALPGDTGQVKDAPVFPAGLVINGVTVAKDSEAPRAVAADASGVYPVSDGEAVASGQTLTWTVSINVSIDPSAAGYTDDALACAADGDGVLQPGRGLFNRVVPEAGKDKSTTKNHDTACADVDPNAGRRSITLIKTGSQGNLDGAAFDVYPVDPSSPGAVPLAGGVAPTGAKGEFTVSALPVNREYWLVETRAPAGHQLLANPVRIKVTATGIEVLNARDLGGSTATVSASAGQDLVNTLTIADIQAGTLPLSGGRGIAPHILAGSVLVGIAGALIAFSSRRCRRAVG
ncbi:SpaA isopeptide-forming pilin-related protein [Actinomyces gaoshouyii]|uniref:Peptidase n=1 Tax=Actinomyces gaoshouyii TaxID=1960083 RepID=A0A8H9LL20_9ACTO|nr:SpaA isopeptide-forming pilin-related protein [Actinomyces gaoshouyii]GGO96384.1 hypothetical protein GCM10011612_06460 [Actinomyces gaoshouyii]